jgi:Protein of unknown function (DUF1656)
MFLPLREINLYGMLVDPAAVMLVVCGVLYFFLRIVMNRFFDLNRFVWRRPLVDIAVLVIFYCAAILTFRPI